MKDHTYSGYVAHFGADLLEEYNALSGDSADDFTNQTFAGYCSGRYEDFKRTVLIDFNMGGGHGEFTVPTLKMQKGIVEALEKFQSGGYLTAKPIPTHSASAEDNRTAHTIAKMASDVLGDVCTTAAQKRAESRFNNELVDILKPINHAAVSYSKDDMVRFAGFTFNHGFRGHDGAFAIHKNAVTITEFSNRGIEFVFDYWINNNMPLKME